MSTRLGNDSKLDKGSQKTRELARLKHCSSATMEGDSQTQWVCPGSHD